MIDPTKPVQTRDGQPVTLKITDGRGNFPLVGYVGSSVKLDKWREDGRWNNSSTPSYNDLVNVTEKRVVWLNLYDTSRSCTHSTRLEADRNASNNRIARLRIELPDDWRGRFDE